MRRASKREMSSNNQVVFKGPSIQGVPLEEIKNKIENVARVLEEKIEDQGNKIVGQEKKITQLELELAEIKVSKLDCF